MVECSPCAKGAGSIPVRVPIFSDYVSRSLRRVDPCPLSSLGKSAWSADSESGRAGLGPSLPYVITARLAPQLALAP